MILPTQHIRKLCTQGWMRPTLDLDSSVDEKGVIWTKSREYRRVMMIEPFTERGEFMGRTFGLGPCTYDFTLDLILTEDNEILKEYVVEPGEPVLASTIEKVDIPFDVAGAVLDKSSWARQFMTAFNTHFDPGFFGYPTLELVNLGRKPLHLIHGMPIIQMEFKKLLEPTEMPYQGKYNGQPARPIQMKEGAGAWGEAKDSMTVGT